MNAQLTQYSSMAQGRLKLFLLKLIPSNKLNMEVWNIEKFYRIFGMLMSIPKRLSVSRRMPLAQETSVWLCIELLISLFERVSDAHTSLFLAQPRNAQQISSENSLLCHQLAITSSRTFSAPTLNVFESQPWLSLVIEFSIEMAFSSLNDWMSGKNGKFTSPNPFLPWKYWNPSGRAEPESFCIKGEPAPLYTGIWNRI